MRLARVAIALGLAAGLPPGEAARAETLPLRSYDVADGLANGRVTAIAQARRGDLWFGTWDGVSRFDGYEFRSFGTSDGLPGSLVTSIAEDRHGGLWFGTFSTGIARLVDDPAERGADPTRKFVSYAVAPIAAAANIGALAVDALNRLWCATSAGIYRADLNEAGAPRFAAVLPGVDVSWPQLLALEPGGRAWAGAAGSVWEIGEGPPVRHPLPATATGDLWNVALARSGGLWVTTGRQLWRFVPKGDGRRDDRWDLTPLGLGVDSYVRTLAEEDDGTLWLGTYDGLLRVREGFVTMFTTANGLPDEKIRALRLDRDGNLWIGTHNGGAAKLPKGGLVNITRSDGLTDRSVLDVTEAADRRIYAVTDRAAIVEIDRGRARPVRGSDTIALENPVIAQSRDGDWWVGIAGGLYRFEGPELRLDRGRRLDARDGLPDPDALVMGLYRDTDGSIWVGQGPHALVHLRPERSMPTEVEKVPLPAPGASWLARRMLRDRSGALWVASFLELGRLRQGRIQSLEGVPGLPDTQVRAIHQDRRGRIWLGHRNRGLSMTEEPEAERPRFRNWTVRDGLSSNTVWAIGEDDAGRIYAGTARGLDRFDPETGRIRHFGPADGLAGSTVNSIESDSRGRLWIAMTGGVSVLDPSREHDAPSPPPVYIAGVAVAGQEIPLPESGTRRLGELTLPWPRNTIAFSWVGVGFESERGLRYQVRLEGADRDWSRASPARSVNYANLGPGRYTFLVRSVSLAGAPSNDAASVSFRILPPFWRRGWFVALCAVAAGAAVFGAYELRVRRLIALERIRRQIATDLHDDMGSGLARIAVLSEVAKRQADPGTAGLMSEIAELARSLRESMSDIVWAVDPRRDRLSDLARRLRQIAYNLFEVEGVALTVATPPDEVLERIELAPDRKRHFFLAAKEALTNAARHAGASHVTMTISVPGSRLRLEVRDDGRGFDTAAATEGRGLASLARRAASLRGAVRIDSSPGRGTIVALEAPLRGEVA